MILKALWMMACLGAGATTLLSSVAVESDRAASLRIIMGLALMAVAVAVPIMTTLN